ncbi:MAG TPA: protein kinase [Cellvibrionaceae bacterium]
MTLHIPGYRIVRTLGKGGMATVYLAVQEIFERPVALKVMAQGLADDPAFGKRFFREARIVSQLVHPNIVTVFDVGVHEGAYYLSMEYIEGQDLKQARKHLNLKQKIQAVQDIARALEFAAQKGYVHRDIKPENIMIAKADQRAVLMDFGIARAAETDLSVTQTGLAIGTPHYMSPEQAKGKAVDARSDLYSLGVVFYLLLTGKVPFDGDSAVAIGIKHITEPAPTVPASLEAAAPILSRLMAKSPADRFQQPADLVSALEALKPLMLEDLSPEEEIPPPAFVSAETLVAVGTGIEPQSMQTAAVDSDALTEYGSHSENAIAPEFSTVSAAGLSWLSVGLILTLAAGVAFFTLWYVYKPSPEASFTALTAAGSGKNINQLRENIALVAKAYQKSEAQLPVLVKLYRDLQKLEPNERRIDQELAALAEQQLKRLTWALNLADYDQAILLDRNLRMLFPEFLTKELSQQQARLTFKEQIQSLLLNAQDYTKSGALSQPPGANAQEAYESILALDPEIAPAREALANIRQQPRASKADTGLPGISTALGTTAEKLSEARRLTEIGQLFAPAGQNANELYTHILGKDPGNPEARQASGALWQNLPTWAHRWVKEGAYNKAREQLEAAAQAKPNDKTLQQLRLSIDEKIVERDRNTLPQVTGLRVAGYPIESFDEPQAQSLSVSKNLHLRIALAQSQLQSLKISLYEGARFRLIKQVPMDVREGMVQYKFEAPSNGFRKGAYTLDLIANGQIVETTRFRIE